MKSTSQLSFAERLLVTCTLISSKSSSSTNHHAWTVGLRGFKVSRLWHPGCLHVTGAAGVRATAGGVLQIGLVRGMEGALLRGRGRGHEALLVQIPQALVALLTPLALWCNSSTRLRHTHVAFSSSWFSSALGLTHITLALTVWSYATLVGSL